MKKTVVLYMDIWPGMMLENAYILATNNPSEKANGVRRYKIQVEIDDPRVPDIELETVGVLEGSVHGD